jgi:hypothetical protein
MATTDLVAVLRSYVERALASVRGAKVLILDAATTRAVSLALSQTDILGHEVYLTERIEGDRGEQLFHLKVSGRRTMGGWGASRAHGACAPPKPFFFSTAAAGRATMVVRDR